MDEPAMDQPLEQPSQHTEPVDDATLAAIDEGLRSAESARKWTLVEALEQVRKQREQWVKAKKRIA